MKTDINTNILIIAYIIWLGKWLRLISCDKKNPVKEERNVQTELVETTNRCSEHAGDLVVAMALVQIHVVEHNVLGPGDRNCWL